MGNISFYLLKNQLIDDFVSGVHKRPEDYCGRAASEKKIDLERRSSAAFFVGHEAAPRLLAGSVKKLRYRRVNLRRSNKCITDGTDSLLL